MSALLPLVFLILLCLLPVFVLYVVVRRRSASAVYSPGVSAAQYIAYISLGVLSLLAALLLQTLVPANRGNSLYNIFIRTALAEEAGRFFVFFAAFSLLRTFNRNGEAQTPVYFVGFAAGLGFAAIETAYYSLTNMNTAILRLVTAAPLHAACASINAKAASLCTQKKIAAATLQIIRAVAIHGLYDLFIIRNNFLCIAAVLFALLNFAAACKKLDRELKGGIE
jgi:RsiW-degrading membrane proteinase PrsW (M82 family)